MYVASLIIKPVESNEDVCSCKARTRVKDPGMSFESVKVP